MGFWGQAALLALMATVLAGVLLVIYLVYRRCKSSDLADELALHRRFVADLVPGKVARVVGTVHVLDSYVVPPLAGDRAVCYETRVQQRSTKEKQWYDSASEKDGVDFLVADETGAVIVRWGSEETRTVKLTYANADSQEYTAPTQMSAKVEEFLGRYGKKATGIMGYSMTEQLEKSQIMRHWEAFMAPGTEVVLTARFEGKRVAEPSTTFDKSQLLVAVPPGSLDKPMDASQLIEISQKEVEEEKGQRGAVPENARAPPLPPQEPVTITVTQDDIDNEAEAARAAGTSGKRRRRTSSRAASEAGKRGAVRMDGKTPARAAPEADDAYDYESDDPGFIDSVISFVFGGDDEKRMQEEQKRKQADRRSGRSGGAGPSRLTGSNLKKQNMSSSKAPPLKKGPSRV